MDQTPPQPPRPAWHDRRWVQLAAALLGTGPIYVLAILGSRSALQDGRLVIPAAADCLLNAVLTCALFCLWIALTQLVLCRELPWQVQQHTAPPGRDILDGITLAGVLLVMQLILGLLLGQGPLGQTPQANVDIGKALADDPLLLAVWLGPVVWLQAALLEEYCRCFLLKRLQRAWPGQLAAQLSVLGSALVFGLGHSYQGLVGIIGTTLIGLVLGSHYARHRRFLPLFIAHGLYDTAVLLALATVASQGATG